MTKPLTFITSSEQETRTLGAKLASEVYDGTNVFLFGDLGMGKTRFVQGFLKEKGIQRTIKSPTFSFHIPYASDNKNIHHIDLYRMESEKEGEALGLETLFASQETVLTEWGDRLTVFPQKRIEIRFFGQLETVRELTIVFHGFTPSLQKVQEILDMFYTPEHVCNHSKQVARTAEECVQNLLSRGEIIDASFVHAASILHDMVRYVDFEELKRDGFLEEVTEERWNFWTSMREKYKGEHHADVAEEILTTLGYAELGSVIQKHKSQLILHEKDSPNTLAEKCLYYADKRVLHDQIVSIQKRYQDARIRYAREDSNFDEMEEKTLLLEAELKKK